MTISEALVELLDDDAARAGLLAMVHNGRAVVRRGQHRVWEASEDGRTVWWQPDPKASRCEVAMAGPDAAVRMISAALQGLKSFRPGCTDAGVCRHPRRLMGGGL